MDLQLPLTSPVGVFCLVLLIILLAPLVLDKLKVPSVIGLILAGLLVGPNGLHWLERDASIILFGTIGLLYLMFLAGFELAWDVIKKERRAISVFGLLTFVIPFLLGSLSAYFLLGYSFWASVLLAAMFSTHTLVAYPIVSKYQLVQNRAVAIAVGGTIITDVLALLVLALVSGMYKMNDAANGYWWRLSGTIIVFVVVIWRLLPLITKWFFSVHHNMMMQFVFVLAMVSSAAYLAELAGLEGIIGAFFSGIVMNKHVPRERQLRQLIEVVGQGIFIPFFMLSVGMLISIEVFTHGLGALKVALIITTIALASKWIAAWCTQYLFKMSIQEGNLLFGLSASHAAATIAIILVGYSIVLGRHADGTPIRLLDDNALNGTIILIMISCLTATMQVEKVSRKLSRNYPSSPK